MFADHLPMILLASVVALALWYKGYIPIPRRTPPRPFSPPYATTASSGMMAPAPEPQQVYGEATPEEAKILTRLDSHTLGVYFALAKRRETEAKVAHDIANQAAEAIGATFSAPFSPPGGGPAPAASAPGGPLS